MNEEPEPAETPDPQTSETEPPEVPTGRRRKMKVKNKAVAGGAVGLVLLGAYFLGGLFDGFGLGTGAGLGPGRSGDSSETADSDKTRETSPVKKTDPPGVELGNVVVVLIDGNEYKVLESPEADSYDSDNYRRASLEQIVEMAQQVEGDGGIKVHVGMRPTSTARAEIQLQNALRDAGLPSEAVSEREDTIP